MAKVTQDTISSFEQLAAFFHRNGYTRPPLEKCLDGLATGLYRRGFEFRLTATDKAELAVIQRELRRAGFTPGKVFTKGNQYRIPVYGRASLERFLEMLKAK